MVQEKDTLAVPATLTPMNGSLCNVPRRVAERKARLRKIERYAPISGKQGKGVGSLKKSILLRKNVQCFIRSMVAE